jgi:hypothetical protein
MTNLKPVVMKTLKFSVHIAAPKEIVWNILWNEESYKKWSSVFQEGTQAVSDRKEGSKILFFSPSGEGMNSIVARKIPHEFLSFRHFDKKETVMEDSNESWSGALENYYLHEEDGITELRVEVTTNENSLKYFEHAFPMALKKVKQMAELPQTHKIL